MVLMLSLHKTLTVLNVISSRLIRVSFVSAYVPTYV